MTQRDIDLETRIRVAYDALHEPGISMSEQYQLRVMLVTLQRRRRVGWLRHREAEVGLA
ncbi:hypothetical protein LCGC14_2410700 [marine sediment metagenome]|uniref:Uncharacterized protein n=1 Tax=marine sediment metagenome TaxID=412755 RepID=A0A0F9CER7_9ZZZZ